MINRKKDYGDIPPLQIRGQALTHEVGATKLQFAWVRGLWNVHFDCSISVLETVQIEYAQSTPYFFLK